VWAEKTGAQFTGMIIPNVFGPFGHPYYNSVVATFCYQLTHDETPKIEIDGELKLIYVSELINIFLRKISLTGNKEIDKIERCEIPFTSVIKVSELLDKLKEFKLPYYENGMIPDLTNIFNRNLFNTLQTFIDYRAFFPFHLKLKSDDRGSFVETAKLNSGGQVSFSTTKPGITRGNHFHTRKAERFVVIKGKAKIEFRKIGSDDKFSFDLNGEYPSFVDMPVWFTHNITNIGKDDLYTIFWISEHFDQSDPDTFFEQV
jgi:UDP-2-acetamido-2,6-beta-L-arabino-hexul-4-ose reductase